VRINTANLRFPLFSKNPATWFLPYIGQMLVHRVVGFSNEKQPAISSSSTSSHEKDRYRPLHWPCALILQEMGMIKMSEMI
jgi:hypothetical protein